MSENTSIEWADDSVNFWTGCTHHGTSDLRVRQMPTLAKEPAR